MVRRALTVLAFTVALSTAVPTFAQQRFRNTVSVEALRNQIPPRAEPIIKKAIQLSHSGDHSGAIQKLLEGRQKCPQAPAHAQSLLGVEYIRTEQYEDAVKALREAVRLLPHDAVNHSNLGLSLAAAGEVSAAVV